MYRFPQIRQHNPKVPAKIHNWTHINYHIVGQKPSWGLDADSHRGGVLRASPSGSWALILIKGHYLPPCYNLMAVMKMPVAVGGGWDPTNTERVPSQQRHPKDDMSAKKKPTLNLLTHMRNSSSSNSQVEMMRSLSSLDPQHPLPPVHLITSLEHEAAVKPTYLSTCAPIGRRHSRRLLWGPKVVHTTRWPWVPVEYFFLDSSHSK